MAALAETHSRVVEAIITQASRGIERSVHGRITGQARRNSRAIARHATVMAALAETHSRVVEAIITFTTVIY